MDATSRWLAAARVLAPKELEHNLKTLLVVNKRLFEVTLLIIHYPYIITGPGHAQVAVTTTDAGPEFERFRVHFECLLVLARKPKYLTDIIP